MTLLVRVCDVLGEPDRLGVPDALPVPDALAEELWLGDADPEELPETLADCDWLELIVSLLVRDWLAVGV